ncbi:MAG: caspase family protein [Bacteroidales bacterium]|nr:caspase family protein [Bacteroidales bacterium]
MNRIFVCLSLFVCLATCGFAQITDETVSELKKTADVGDVVAQKYLGDLYYGGGTFGNEVVEKDLDAAIYWYGRAAELDDAASQFILGFIYRDIDKEKAMYWMKKYADQGYDTGQAMVGYWYLGNDGFAKDDLQAVAWLKKAADQGNKQAAADLSMCYATGRGVPKDLSMSNLYKEKSEEKDVEISDLLAAVQWSDFEPNVANNEYPLNLEINSKSKVQNVTVMLNGVAIKNGVRETRSMGYDLNVKCGVTLAEGANTIEVIVRNAAGIMQESKTIVYGTSAGRLASIEWLEFEPTASKTDYKMKIGIKSESKIEDVSITHNGEKDRGIRTVESDSYDMVVEKTIALVPGLNRIKASVLNAYGIATAEKTVNIEIDTDTTAYNDKRIAMIVGNSNYSDGAMNLSNPKNDAEDVAAKLKSLGFDVILKIDATLQEMDRELTNFGLKAKGYDVALFYYAGHGIQSKGVNYLLPTDIENLAEDNIKYKCVDMDRILGIMEDSKCKLNIVILDACRNDPISRSWHRSVESHGLSLMNAPEGTIISFSTAPGHTALDGTGRNSPYTTAFLNALDYPKLDVLHFLKMVGQEVINSTQNVQRPWMSSSFTGDFYFNNKQ